MNDLRALRPYDLPTISMAVVTLADQAETQSRNRRPIRAAITWCPAATWQLRVGGYRVLYRVADGVVEVLRVRWKGSGTTEEMGP